LKGPVRRETELVVVDTTRPASCAVGTIDAALARPGDLRARRSRALRSDCRRVELTPPDRRAGARLGAHRRGAQPALRRAEDVAAECAEQTADARPAAQGEEVRRGVPARTGAGPAAGETTCAKLPGGARRAAGAPAQGTSLGSPRITLKHPLGTASNSRNKETGRTGTCPVHSWRRGRTPALARPLSRGNSSRGARRGWSSSRPTQR